ncbi:hypothetical protein RTG_01570 [Rhodotorula toruloides ATCC 204091]|uniref:Uncharacterized protein n=1 Tax=Rhodotorula toruloides TaxID=5286 RepID=A0A0K3CS67_RHOTO|nr:hypothetical protein RTG_01570 [Rhodotorula toruloides ATCC 204091]PRQ71263.1 hypothetical protein AAT19DRAFT_10121 [Rhodotorula toruloides]
MLQTRIARHTVAALPIRAALRLPCPPHLPSARPFATTRPARFQFETAPFGSPDDSLRDRLDGAADIEADPQDKVEAWPLLLPRDRAVTVSEVAAATAVSGGLGLRMGLHHLAKRFLGYEGLRPHVKMVAFKAVYLPMWFVDLSASATAVMGDEWYNLSGMSFAFESFRVPIPGFNLPPLTGMPIRVPEAPPSLVWKGEDFDPSIPSIPFTRHPLNIPQKLKALPRRVARDEDDVGFDPSRAKFRMIANYPTYMPVYLGEWEVESTEFESGTTRVTSCMFADTPQPRFCMYLQKTPDSQPEWRPASASTFTLSLSARPASAAVWAAQSAKSSNMKKSFAERLQAAIDGMKEEREQMGEGIVEWTDVLPEGGILDFTAKQDRVCSHETWQDINEAYTEALEKYELAREFQERLKEMRVLLLILSHALFQPANNVALIRPSLRSPIQRIDRNQLLERVGESVDEWREFVEESKPNWLRKAEENEKIVAGRETSKTRARDRGRRVPSSNLELLFPFVLLARPPPA